MTRNDLQRMTYQLGVRNDIYYPFGEEEIAGNVFHYFFFSCLTKVGVIFLSMFHYRQKVVEIFLKTTSQPLISKPQLTRGFSKEKVYRFFDLLEDMMKKHHYSQTEYTMSMRHV